MDCHPTLGLGLHLNQALPFHHLKIRKSFQPINCLNLLKKRLRVIISHNPNKESTLATMTKLKFPYHIIINQQNKSNKHVMLAPIHKITRKLHFLDMIPQATMHFFQFSAHDFLSHESSVFDIVLLPKDLFIKEKVQCFFFIKAFT